MQVCGSVFRWQSDSFIGGLCCQSEVGVGDCEVSTPLGHTSPYGFSNTLLIIPKHGTKTQPPPHTPSRCVSVHVPCLSLVFRAHNASLRESRILWWKDDVEVFHLKVSLHTWGLVDETWIKLGCFYCKFLRLHTSEFVRACMHKCF